MNMCFNLGWPRLSSFKKMLAALQVKDYETAAREALNVRWAQQVGGRAQRIAHMIKAKLVLQPLLAQIELNKIEAAHRLIFVAGWRPFIGWVCGFALLWHFVLYDLLSWISLNTISADVKLPELVGTDALISIVIALLGLGGMRSLEKLSGQAK